MKRLFPLFAFIMVLLSSCAEKEEPMRYPQDILGVWSPKENVYWQFRDDNTTTILEVRYQDDETIGILTPVNAYYYDPGYNLVVYVDDSYQATVYQVITLTEDTLTWCPVDVITDVDKDSVGKIIGDIINKAQEGYNLNPELYQSFVRFPEEEYLEIEDSLDEIFYPGEI